LHVLERRERERGDREIGLARWQFERIHFGGDYDLTIDASAATPMDARSRLLTPSDCKSRVSRGHSLI
jgi:chloramphenicol 3-O phosphotransferase